MESMTNAPHLLNGSRTGVRYGAAEFIDHLAFDGLTNPYDGKAMGVFGDMACETYGFDRTALDAYRRSVKRAQAAQASGASRLKSSRSRSRVARARSWSIPTKSRARSTPARSRRCAPRSARTAC